MRIYFSLLLIGLQLLSTAALAATPALNIKLNSGNESEKKAKALIEGFLQKYDLKPYVFTKEIIIKSYEIPHSHPVLTLNTREIDEPTRYLALFLHEQIHWFFNEPNRHQQTDNFIEKMKAKYPDIPPMEKGGGRNTKSTYLHLGVCYYEFIALSKLLGDAEATRLFKTRDVYSWILKRVLKDRKFIGETLIESGLAWVEAGSSK